MLKAKAGTKLFRVSSNCIAGCRLNDFIGHFDDTAYFSHADIRHSRLKMQVGDLFATGITILLLLANACGLFNHMVLESKHHNLELLGCRKRLI